MRLAPTLAALLLALLATSRPAAAETVFTWSQGQPPTQLEPVATHVCVLTGIAGSFRGLGERVTLAATATHWTLDGTSQQDGVGATARCVPTAAFSSPDIARSTPVNDAAVTSTPRGCLQTTFQAAPGDSLTAISAMSGAFNGGGEAVEIRPQGDHWLLATRSKSGDGTFASARCVAWKQ